MTLPLAPPSVGKGPKDNQRLGFDGVNSHITPLGEK